MWRAMAGLHPWADRLNEITKYVFSSTLDVADELVVGMAEKVSPIVGIPRADPLRADS
jgi:hypothetical protein